LPFSDHNLELGEEAVNHVIALLEKFGYNVKRNELSREFSRSILISEEKAELHTFPGLAFDLFIGPKGKETAYLAEIKGKSKEAFKCWVDKDLYENYYAFAKINFPFLYFVWIKETDRIYRHAITNPEKFKTRDDDVYLIPKELIHEVNLKEGILLSACRSKEALMNALENYKGETTYYEKNKVRILARCKAYRETHKEQVNAYRRAYYSKNKVQLKASHKVYDDNHREQKRARDRAYSKARYAKYKAPKGPNVASRQ